MDDTGTDAEKLFPPKPGGMVDTARKRAEAEAEQILAIAETVGQQTGKIPAVRVRPDEPDSGTARTVTLSSANLVAQILPRDPSRRSAVVLAVDNDVWISTNEGTAGDLAGSSGAGSAFYLPAGIAVPVTHQAQVWASPTTTATSSRVSVMVSRDSQP